VTATGIAGAGVYGTDGLMTATQLNNEFRPYYTTNGNYMVWHDYAVIKLNYLFESLNKIGLVKRFDAQSRLWINTGTVHVNVVDASTTDTSYRLPPAQNTFFNTCPLIINYQNETTSILPTGVLNIVAGLYINKAPTTNFAGLNLANAAVCPYSHILLHIPPPYEVK